MQPLPSAAAPCLAASCGPKRLASGVVCRTLHTVVSLQPPDPAPHHFASCARHVHRVAVRLSPSLDRAALPPNRVPTLLRSLCTQ
ncbi:hypothetical protein GUJ93_ZPchr0007g3273 [Zizania palustris]|nr:hypothetical protein GUJ93_ZPchr0007g3273 [Zizania palustris]